MGQIFSVLLRVDAGSLPTNFQVGARANQPPFQPKIGPKSAAGAVDVQVTNTSVRDGAVMLTLTFIMTPRRNAADVAPPADGGEGAAPATGGQAARPVINLNWPLPLAYQQVDVPIEFSDIPFPK